MLTYLTIMLNIADQHAQAKKRGFCSYDDKRYLRAELLDKNSKIVHTHAYRNH